MKIQKKLLLSVLLTMILAFTVTIAIVSYNGTLLLKNKAVQLSGEMAQHYGFEIRNTIENKIAVVEQVNHVLSSLKKDKVVDREIYNHILHDVLEKNKDILGMWVIYEPNALDGRDKEFIDKPGHDKTGRYIPYFNRGAGDIKLEALTDYDKEGAGDYFLIPKRTKKMAIIEPYLYKVNGQEVLMTSISMPLIENGVVIGVVGIDFSLKEYAKFCETIRPLGVGYINVASNNGTYICNQLPDLIGKNIKDNTHLSPEAQQEILQVVKEGKTFDLIDKEHGYLRSVRPMDIGNLGKPWMVSTVIPLNEVAKEVNTLTQTVIITAVSSVITIALLIIILVNKIIQHPLSVLQQLIQKISHTGQFHHRAAFQSSDEFGILVQSVNELSASLESTFKETNVVMTAVTKGDFSKRIMVNVKGDIRDLKENVNISIETIAKTMDDLTSVMVALMNGDFSKRIHRTMEGQFQVMFEHANTSMQTLEHIIVDINQTMSASAQGDFSKRIEVDAMGQLANLKDNINNSTLLIAQTIHEVNQVMKQLAVGNLIIQIDPSQYQNAFQSLMHNIQQATFSLRDLIIKVVQSVHVINTGTAEIALGNTDLATRTSEQASSLEQTTSSLESVLDKVNLNTASAKEASHSAQHSMEVAEQGGQVVEEIMMTIQDIAASSQKINEIITIIDNISFQTNILSLNAAVESARAGEAGRGFAVVANEVRTLAQRSANSAKDIGLLITQTVNKISNASQRVERAGNTMHSIVQAVQNVSTMMAQIVHSSVEQAESIQQVKIAVDQLNSITQHNASLVEQISATSESLEQQTVDLQNTTRAFQI